MLVNLKPRDKRSGTASDIIRRLRAPLADVGRITSYMQPVQDLTIDDKVSRTQYQFVLESANTSDLTTWIPKLTEKMRALPQINDVASDLSEGGLAAFINIDRDTAARFGITAATIDNALYDAFGQRIISTIFTESTQYRVIMEADPAMQRSPDSLSQIYVPSASGGQVPLSAIAKFEQRPASLLINHLGQFPLKHDLPSTCRAPVPWEAPVNAIHKAEAEIGMPPSIVTSFQGAASAFESSALQRAVPDRGRDPDDVHHPGDPLRELHPPDHDPVDPPVGGHRGPSSRSWSSEATWASSASSASSC